MTSTAVRVALRVRPLTPKEQMSSCSECLTFIPDEPQILIGTDRSFTFDYVFSPETPQRNVYEESVEPLLEKFVEGQTGSGKTYSMGTGLDGNLNSENQGIVPRAIHALFASLHKQQRESSRFSYQVYVSFLELYNEDLVDLLNPQKKANGEQTVSIREDKQGNIYWAGVREELVNSPEELLGFLQKGSLCRTTGSTDMNATSSRSHAIFSVILKQQRLDESWNDSPTPPVTPAEDKDDKEEREDDGSRSRSRSISRNGSGSEVTRTTSKFHFVDLAGSERLKRTGASGDRAKEGISINAGLLALGNVISALGDETRKATHVPYRDSKLTRLLQDSLGGNSQTLMLACCSPSDSNFMETLNTLKYANRARNIKNRVTVNQDFGGNSVEINQLRAQVQRLKLELNAMRESRGDEVVSRDYETETRGLKSEIIRLRDRIQEVGKELQDVKIERDTLLIDRDIGGLFPKDDGIDEDSEEEAENRVRAHPIIVRYTETIEQLKSELADTQDRLAIAEIQAQTVPKPAVPPSPSASSSFTLMRNHHFLSDLDEEEEMEDDLLTQSSRTNRSTLQPGQLTRGRHRRRRRKHPNVLTPSSSGTKAVDRLLASTSTVPDIVEPKSQPHLGRRGSTVSALSENTAMTASELGGEEEEKFSSLLEGTLVRKEVEETIERAKEEIRKGMEFLEVVKPESKKRRSSHTANTEDAPVNLVPSQSSSLKQRRRSSLLLMANAPNKPEFIPSPLPSPVMTDGGDQSDEAAVLIESGDALTEQEGQSLVQGYDGDLLAGVSTLPVPTWTQTPPRAYSQTVSRGNSGTWTDGDQSQSDYSAASTARSNTSTFTPTQLPRDRNHNPQLLRMLHQIQADIAVKEELVAQLERSELEYTYMRAQYEERLNMLQEHLLEVQKQRDLALRRAGFTIRPESSIHLKEKHQVIEVKHLYEAKMKRLLAEIQDLRRKYTQTNTAMQTTRNQNESLLRGLRVNVESLKLEKKRMLKRMKEESERVREQALANERMIAALRRKEANAIEARKRLEREHELQKQALKKRSEEVVHSNAQLKHLMAVMKRMTMSNMANKNPGAVASLSRSGRKSSPLKNSTTQQPAEEVNKPPVHVRALRKKQLLDRAMYQYIAAKQAVNEMEQVLKRREILSQEKAELLVEREHTITSEVERCGQSGEFFDPEQPLHMDERIELITAEVTYLNARIRALQAEAADFSDMMEPEHRVSRAGKRVSFSEDVVGGNDQWMDVDNLEERYCLSPTAGPDASYEMAVSLVRSLESDESKRMAEALIEDIVVLRTNEWSKQMNEQTLEKTIQDLRRTLLVMRKAAVDATIQQERKIKQLEVIVNKSSNYYGDLPTPVDDMFENGNTIFDKIYEDAINGTLSSVSSLDTPLSITNWNDDDCSGFVQSPSPLSTTSSAFKYNRAGRPTQLTSLDLNKINGCSRNSSPDRLIQLAQQKTRVSPSPESPSLPPPDFAKYLSERENSQAAPGIARSGSISTAESRPKLLYTPKKKLRAEFDDNASDTSSVNGDSPKENSRSGTPSRASPSPASTSSTLNRRPASSSSTQSGRDVFRRLSSSHTLASQAKMSKHITNDMSLAGLAEDEAGEYEDRSLETRVPVEAM
ncbi:hypothetical protein BC937DRAFT_89158 [Endogone sp. FLAS-F59071]|nr:hypothetical protein BC937DRAFT_89158 [Endogone sp. FLAS-F59071]|eukprot:RUS22443.1 hypothetical protein BC937DRAFT_89158 [Endogone sp. FLAS-F59071]